MLDKLNIEHHEKPEGKTAIEGEVTVGIPIVGIELVMVEKVGKAELYARREGDTLPRYQLYPETKEMPYTEEDREEYK